MKEALFTSLTETNVLEVETTINSFLMSRANYNGDIVILYSKYESLTEQVITYFRTKYKAIVKLVDNSDLDFLHAKIKSEANPHPRFSHFLAVETFGETEYEKITWAAPNTLFMKSFEDYENQGDAIFFKRDPAYKIEKTTLIQSGTTQVNTNFFIIKTLAIGKNYNSFVYKNLLFNRDISQSLTYFLVNYLAGKCRVKILDNTTFPTVENFNNLNFQQFLANQPNFIAVDFNFVHNVNQKNYIKIIDILKKSQTTWKSEIGPRLEVYNPVPDAKIYHSGETAVDVPTNIQFNKEGQTESLCIIVPYRNREEHLEQFIPYMTEYLENNNNIQDYIIAIIEQADALRFNRAKLINIGFIENPTFDYYCFHDVDMLPERADYSFENRPLHLATQCSQFNYKMPYPLYYGGVTMVPAKDFKKVNGFNNEYWGWGAEDDDFYSRLKRGGCNPGERQGRFLSLPHKRDVVHQQKNENYHKMLKHKEETFHEQIKSGISNASYSVIDRTGYGKIKFIKVKL